MDHDAGSAGRNAWAELSCPSTGSDHHRQLSLDLPEMGHITEVFCYPTVAIDRIEVSLAFVGEDCGTGGARLDLVFYLFDRHQHGARRSTRQNRFITHQAPATNHTL